MSRCQHRRRTQDRWETEGFLSTTCGLAALSLYSGFSNALSRGVGAAILDDVNLALR